MDTRELLSYPKVRKKCNAAAQICETATNAKTTDFSVIHQIFQDFFKILGKLRTSSLGNQADEETQAPF
jgi:hypothetical protein